MRGGLASSLASSLASWGYGARSDTLEPGYCHSLVCWVPYGTRTIQAGSDRPYRGSQRYKRISKPSKRVFKSYNTDSKPNKRVSKPYRRVSKPPKRVSKQTYRRPLYYEPDFEDSHAPSPKYVLPFTGDQRRKRQPKMLEEMRGVFLEDMSSVFLEEMSSVFLEEMSSIFLEEMSSVFLEASGSSSIYRHLKNQTNPVSIDTALVPSYVHILS